MKARTGKRRCEWCRQWYGPSTGGRPAKYCGPSCRQRAYEACKRARLDAGPKIVPVPQLAPLIAMVSPDKPLFTPDQAKAVFPKEVLREEADFDLVAERLNLVAEQYTEGYHQRTAGAVGTMGKERKRFLSLGPNFDRALAYFGSRRPLDHLDSNKTINAINTLSVAEEDGRDLYLRTAIAREIGFSGVPSSFHTLRACVRGLQYLKHLEQLAADAAERNGRARRKTPREQLNLVGALHVLYHEVTGEKDWQSTPPEGGLPAGPFVDFVAAVVAHMEAISTGPLAENLRRLKAPYRIAKLIARIPKVLKSTQLAKVAGLST